MASAHEKKFAEGVREYLAPGETVLASCIAQALGYSRLVISGASLGREEVAQSSGAAAAGELRVANPMALVLTDRRLLTVRISTPIGLGIGGNVKEVLTSIPLGEIDSIEVRRIALRQNISLRVRGVEVPLETNAKANAKGVAEAFERMRVSA